MKLPEGFYFKAMECDDVAAVAAMEEICFRSPWSKSALMGELANDVAHYRLLMNGLELVGYAGMWLIFGEAHITNVAIAPDYRRRGLGRALMLHMMEYARAKRGRSMTLEVRESNLAAQDMYYSLGFKKAGIRKRYYSDTGENALILWNKAIKDTLSAEST